MEFFKLVGSLTVVLSGLGLGAYLNRTATESLTRIEAWIKMIRFTKLQVDCFSLPVEEIIGRADLALLSDCGFRGGERPKRFDLLLSRCFISDGHVRSLLSDFAREFGAGYREEQLRGCDYYIHSLEERRTVLAGQLEGRKKRNVTLSLSGALATVILFV